MADRQSVVQRSFAGGELAPALHMRADQARYQTGLRRCRNFVVQRHGGVQNRAGFRFIAECKTPDIGSSMLLRYVHETAGESVLLEMSEDVIRFYKDDGLLTVDLGDVDAWDIGIDYLVGDLVQDGGIIYYALENNVATPPPAAEWHAFVGTTYELPNPFGLDFPNWYQSGRCITLTHKLHPPYELIYESLTVWVLRPVGETATIAAPTGAGAVPGGAGAFTLAYQVTAAADDTFEEGPPSATIVLAGTAEPTTAAPVVISWTAVPGAAEYYVYADPYANGVFGLLGVARGGVTFRDVGVAPDFAVSPPEAHVVFGVDDYPNTATDYQQRRFFAHTVNNPDIVRGSRTGLRSNFDTSTPLQDDDALTFRLAGNNNNPVRHLVGLKTLIVLTDAGEWTVGEPKVPITPSSIPADQETYVGCGDPRPVVIGNAIIYVQARGSIVRDLQFNQQVEGLGGTDLTIFAAHLFEGRGITRIDYAQTPHSVVWAVRTDGTLLGLTYVREQEVYGWHRHDTGATGRFEDVCVLPEALEDAVYVIVRRTIDGNVVRYIEKLARRTIQVFDTDAFFVDCGLSYSGAPTVAISGLDHLEGEVVAVVADGAVIFAGDPAAANVADFTVTGGAIANLAVAASNVHVGLPIRFAEIELLSMDVNGADVRDKKKRVAGVTVLVDESTRTFDAGPDSTHLMTYSANPYDVPADEFSGQVELDLIASFTEEGRVFFRATQPLPLTILGVVPSVELGG